MATLRQCVHLVAAIAVITAAGCVAARPKTGAASETPEANRFQMTQEELQSAVISYANRFIATVGQAAFRFEEKIETPEARLIASARKVYSLSAVTEIAAGPNPGSSLLDLVVMTTLNRIVWEEYWRPQVFGMPATIIVEAFATMEKDAWDLAAKVMTREQMDELMDVILDWWADHPEQIAVDYIRFSDFGDLGKKPNLKEIQKPGGLLAPVREATEAVDEVRQTSERAMFLLTKMQIIVGFQVEQIYKQLMLQPEMVRLLEDVDRFQKTSGEFAALFEQLPQQVAAEREAALKEIATLVAAEREAALAAFDAREGTLRGLMQEVQATLDRVDTTFANLEKTTADAEKLLGGTERTVAGANELVRSVDRLAARFDTGAPGTPAKPFDINEYTEALARIETTLNQLNALVLSVEKTSTPLLTNFTQSFNEAADARVDHIFIRLVQLFSIIAAFAAGVVVLYLLLRRRMPAGPS